MKNKLLILISLLFLNFLIIRCQDNSRVSLLIGNVYVDSNFNRIFDDDELGFPNMDLVPLEEEENYLGEIIETLKTNQDGQYLIDGLKERFLYKFNLSNPAGYLFESYDISLECLDGKVCYRRASPSEGYLGSIVVQNIKGYQVPLIPVPGIPAGKSILCIKIFVDLGPPPVTEPPQETEPPTTEPPVTQPPVTQPPVTQPPVTTPPVTTPPVTTPPVTQPPVTTPPVTQPPVTTPPVTTPPVTQPPVTTPPVTTPPVTTPPVTTPPVTTPPVTTPPVTTPPVTTPPITQPPVTTPPITQPPVTTPPITTPPVTEPPILKDCVAIVGKIFLDYTGNRKAEPFEPYFPNMEKALLDSSGNPAKDKDGAPVPSSITGDDGRFVFENLNPGTYFIKCVNGSKELINPGNIGPFTVNNNTASQPSDNVKCPAVMNLGDYGLIPVGESTISGKIFNDTNHNSKFDVTEKGYPGINVTCYYQVYNYAVQSAVSDENGYWEINGIWPEIPLKCIFGYDDVKSSTCCPPVRFAVGGDEDVDFCLFDHQPSDATNTTTFLYDYPEGTYPSAFITTCFLKGGYNSSSTRLGTTIIRFTPDAVGINDTYKSHLAQQFQTGSLNGITYRPETNLIFASAYLKTAAGFGPCGAGAIYKIEPDGVTCYVDLNELFGANYTGNLTIITPNGAASDFKDQLSIWKASLGDLDSTLNYLYVSNLFTNEIIRIPLNEKPTAINTLKIKVPNLACNNPDDFHIFANKVYKGKLYVGAACSGENDINQIIGIIVRYDNVKWEKVVTFDLKIWKFKKWQRLQTYSQPQGQITQMAFDDEGFITVSVRDRQGDLSTDNVESSPSLFLMCPDSNGGYVYEEPGKCGNRVVQNRIYDRNLTHFYNSSFANGPRALGFSVTRAGPTTLLSNSYDLTALYSGDVAFVNSTTGGAIKFYELLKSEPGNYGKANGLGNLDAIDPMPPYPTQQMCVVWYDTNCNGRQESDEFGISNITITVSDDSNNQFYKITNTNGDAVFDLVPGKTYTSSIQSSEIKTKIGDFSLSPVLSSDQNDKYCHSNAQVDGDNIKSSFDKLIYSTKGFVGCRFGITKPGTCFATPYGYSETNATYSPIIANPFLIE